MTNDIHSLSKLIVAIIFIWCMLLTFGMFMHKKSNKRIWENFVSTTFILGIIGGVYTIFRMLSIISLK